MNIDSILKVVRGIVRLRGATDNTLIGNESDSLKTVVTNERLSDDSLIDFRSSQLSLLKCIVYEQKKTNKLLKMILDLDSDEGDLDDHEGEI